MVQHQILVLEHSLVLSFGLIPVTVMVTLLTVLVNVVEVLQMLVVVVAKLVPSGCDNACGSTATDAGCGLR
jgi:hypothetical protein